MKKNVWLLLAFFVLAIFYTSCEEEENQKINDPYLRIEGKWNMDAYTQRGDPMLQLDGSFWKFTYNDTTEAPHQGIDSLVPYGSSGSFDYEFSKGEDTLFVTDTLQYGGYFNGDWVIMKFEDKALKLVREYDDQWGDTLKFSRE